MPSSGRTSEASWQKRNEVVTTSEASEPSAFAVITRRVTSVRSFQSQPVEDQSASSTPRKQMELSGDEVSMAPLTLPAARTKSVSPFVVAATALEQMPGKTFFV